MFETKSSSPSLVFTRKKLQGTSISKRSTTSETQTSPPLIVFSRNKQRGVFFSKISNLGTIQETENSSPIFVYRRKKQQGISISKLSTGSTISEYTAPNFVYRRKRRQFPADQKKNGDSVSVISSDEQNVASLAIRANEAFQLCNRETSNLKSLAIYEASKNNVDGINDCCSSSKSNLELALASKQTDLGECSSSSATVGEYQTEKEFCTSILKSQGQLEDVFRVTNSEGNGNDIAESCLLPCKICGNSETTIKMLICDNCDEAFHLSCCNIRKKNVAVDEWLCHSCLRKKQKHLKETNIGNKSASSKRGSNPIALMLNNDEAYTSGVRIGKEFQADVPDWSGPVMIDDVIHEELQVDPSECVNFNEIEVNPSKLSKLSFIGNWLQCKEIIDSGEGLSNETICGKWRRAPLFAVQTEDWECFCSVFWDPSRADCAAPQELETDEVLKQLKYIEKVRPSLEAKRKKMVSSKPGKK